MRIDIYFADADPQGVSLALNELEINDGIKPYVDSYQCVTCFNISEDDAPQVAEVLAAYDFNVVSVQASPTAFKGRRAA